jgi:hypothetical protein
VASPPTGTVTFLFTDIEGSMRMWEQNASAMQEALARHDEGRCTLDTTGNAIRSTRGKAEKRAERVVSATSFSESRRSVYPRPRMLDPAEGGEAAVDRDHDAINEVGCGTAQPD